MCQWVYEVYLSILKAHRLSTVIPTEAFWTNGTSLHRVTPNGQSSARSWREMGGRVGVGEVNCQTPYCCSSRPPRNSVLIRTRNVSVNTQTSFSVYCYHLSFFDLKATSLSREKTQLNLSITGRFMSAVIEGLECKRRSIGIICGSASPPYHHVSRVSALVCNRVQLF